MGIITFLIYMCVFISLCVCAFERALGTIFAHIFIFCVNYVCVRGALGKHLRRGGQFTRSTTQIRQRLCAGALNLRLCKGKFTSLQGRLRLCTYVFLCRVYWMQGLSKGDKRL